GGRASDIDRSEAFISPAQKPVNATGILEPPHDLAGGVDPMGFGAGRARDVDGNEAAVSTPKKAVNAAAVSEPSHDLPCRVDSIGRSVDPASGIDRGEAAVGTSEEAVAARRILERSHDLASVVHSDGVGLEGAGNRNGGEAVAVQAPQEALIAALAVDAVTTIPEAIVDTAERAVELRSGGGLHDRRLRVTLAVERRPAEKI